jgi:hypothetical protein
VTLDAALRRDLSAFRVYRTGASIAVIHDVPGCDWGKWLRGRVRLVDLVDEALGHECRAPEVIT